MKLCRSPKLQYSKYIPPSNNHRSVILSVAGLKSKFMTPERIQQIAETYANSVVPNRKTYDDEALWGEHLWIAKFVIKTLADKYLIVEKSIVEEMRELSDSAKYDKDYMTSQNARAEYNLLEALFPRTINPDEK